MEQSENGKQWSHRWECAVWGGAPTVQTKENRPQISLKPISMLTNAQLLLLLTHATIVVVFHGIA